MEQKEMRWLLVLLVLLLVTMTVNIVVTIKSHWPVACESSLPCSAIPTRFVLEYPDCADKLVRAMNITDVHIVTFNKSAPDQVHLPEG